MVHDLRSTVGILGHLITANSSSNNVVDDDIEHAKWLWRMLRTVANIAIERCDEAMGWRNSHVTETLPDGTHNERTKAALAAAHDLTCLGEIMEAIGTNDDVTGALVGWLGERIGKATAVAHSFILSMPAG